MDNPRRLTPIHSSDDDLHDPIEEDGLSLEELSQSYQRVLTGGGAGTLAGTLAGDVWGAPVDGQESRVGLGEVPITPPWPLELLEDAQPNSEQSPLTPQSIVEAVLFVGRPDGGTIAAAEIAALMRGVSESEVIEHVSQLNVIYAESARATRIISSGSGYRLQLADDLNFIRDRFYGRVRQVKLNQSAIDCLALIAYQPGITRQTLEEQRGQASGSVLNQLVRRQLVDMRREPEDKTPNSSKLVSRYYPTERLFELAGIESLEDLPQTEDF